MSSYWLNDDGFGGEDGDMMSQFFDDGSGRASVSNQDEMFPPDLSAGFQNQMDPGFHQMLPAQTPKTSHASQNGPSNSQRPPSHGTPGGHMGQNVNHMAPMAQPAMALMEAPAMTQSHSMGPGMGSMQSMPPQTPLPAPNQNMGHVQMNPGLNPQNVQVNPQSISQGSAPNPGPVDGPGMMNMMGNVNLPTQNMMNQGAYQNSLDRAKQEQLIKMRQQIMHQQMLQNRQMPGSPSVEARRTPSGPMPGVSPKMGQMSPNQLGQTTPLMGVRKPLSLGPPMGQMSGAQVTLGTQPPPGPGQQTQMGKMRPPQMPQMPPASHKLQNQMQPSQMQPSQMPAASPMPSMPAQAPPAQAMQAPMAPNGGPAPGGMPKLTQAQVAHLQQELFHLTLTDFMARRGTPITQPPAVNNKRVNLLALHVLSRKIGGAQAVLRHLQQLNNAAVPATTDWTKVCEKIGLFDGVDYRSNSAAKHQVEKLLGSCYLQFILPYEQYVLTEEGQRDIKTRHVQFQRRLLMRLQRPQPKAPFSPSVQLPGAAGAKLPVQASPAAQSSVHSPGLSPGAAVARKSPSVASNLPEPELPQGEPNTIKKYVPIRETTTTYGGHDLKQLSELAAEIELIKPVYLFAPELGLLNIHALVMSLKNYTALNPGEVFAALNTLLVTTTDSNFAFKVLDAPELLDTLAQLGRKVVDQIVGEAQKEDFTEVTYEDGDEIDAVFGRFQKEKGEDVAVVVDSLTGEQVQDDSDDEFDGLFPPEERPKETEEKDDEQVPHFSVPSYMEGLHAFKAENRHHFSRLQVKSAADARVFLVDLLIIVTMTLRNLSFAEDSRAQMAGNEPFRQLLFAIVRAVSVRPAAFVFQRKRFCLLKDCLVMLNQVAYLMELESLEEAFLTFLLVSAFAPALAEDSCAIPQAPLDVYTYLPYAVDTFAKLLVREPRLRAYMQAVLTGLLAVLGEKQVAVSGDDVQKTRRLVQAYFHGDTAPFRAGVLLTRAFKLMMSVVTFGATAVEFTRFVFQRSLTVLQALFGAKLLVDLVDDLLAELPLRWLRDNVQNLLVNFSKFAFAVVSELVKFARALTEHRVLSYVAVKILIVVNSLLGRAVELQRLLAEEDCAPQRALFVRRTLGDLQHLYRVRPENEFVLNTLLTLAIDPDVETEMVRVFGLMGAVLH